MSPIEVEIVRRKLAPSAGLRNRLVHEYDRLEHSMVLKAVNMAEELYSKYIKSSVRCSENE